MYKAGTVNYVATFQSLDKYTITYAETKGAANTNPTQYNILDSITFNALPNVTGYTFKGWATSSGATSAAYTDKQSVKNLTARRKGRCLPARVRASR